MTAVAQLHWDDVVTTMEDFASRQPHVIFWNSACSELQWLHSKEDQQQACNMYLRMSVALQARYFVDVSAAEPVTVGEHTFFPMLTHSPGQPPNRVHWLLTGKEVCATPYFFLDQKTRDSVHQFVCQVAAA